MCMKKMPKEVCMDVCCKSALGLASHLVSGNVGEIGEGLKENKVLRSFLANHGAKIGFL